MTDQIRRVRAAEPGAQVDRRTVRRFRDGDSEEDGDVVAIEEPLEIRVVHGPEGERAEFSMSITMRTPGADTQLALGFLLAEGVISVPTDVIRAGPHGPLAAGRGFHNRVQVELGPAVVVDPSRLSRHVYTTSSCGVCGKASLEALRTQPRLARLDVPGAFTMGRAAFMALPAGLMAVQQSFALTGGLHAAGVFDATGSIESVYEDVGRHNALDKLVGAALLDGDLPWQQRGVVLSGRASFELLQKAMMAGAPLVASIGAPSSLAIDLASEFGMTLIGFLRSDGFNVYAGAERVGG